MLLICGCLKNVKLWSIPNNQIKYEFDHGCGYSVKDIVIGREGTPLANRFVLFGQLGVCRISNLETGEEVKSFILLSCRCIAVDEAQTVIAIGNDINVTFIETTNFTKVKKISFERSVNSLAFNKRNDCLLAVTCDGDVHSLKF